MVASRKYAAGLRPDPILSETPYGAIFWPRVYPFICFISLRCRQFRL